MLATRSHGKLRELRPLFAEHGVDVVDLAAVGIAEGPDEDALECFDTYEENALAKARYFAARTGLPVVADDSGLEVIALGGQPGVRSKRWSGRSELAGHALDQANNDRLRAAIQGVRDRSARYVCAAVYCGRGVEIVRRGETVGHILDEPVGSEGFGYDPWFFSDELGAAFGAVGVGDKAVVSHRGRAFRALLAALRKEPGAQ